MHTLQSNKNNENFGLEFWLMLLSPDLQLIIFFALRAVRNMSFPVALSVPF